MAKLKIFTYSILSLKSFKKLAKKKTWQQKCLLYKNFDNNTFIYILRINFRVKKSNSLISIIFVTIFFCKIQLHTFNSTLLKI